MAFKKVDDKNIKKIRKIGVLKETTKFRGGYLEVSSECELVLYDRKEGKYYKVHKMVAKLPADDAPIQELFDIYLNLLEEQHVEYVGSDQNS